MYANIAFFFFFEILDCVVIISLTLLLLHTLRLCFIVPAQHHTHRNKTRETFKLYRTWTGRYSRSISPDVGQVHLSVLFLDLLSETLSQPLNIQLISRGNESAPRIPNVGLLRTNLKNKHDAVI